MKNDLNFDRVMHIFWHQEVSDTYTKLFQVSQIPNALLVSLLIPINLFSIRFYVADKAVGAKGFKAIWSEIKDTSNCQEFRCAHSMICIPLNLRCNGINNCGANDNSDELKCKFNFAFTK